MGGQDLFADDFDAYEALLVGEEDFDYTSVSWARDDVDFLDCTTSGSQYVCRDEPLFRGDLGDSSFGKSSLATFITDKLLPRVEESVRLGTVVTKIDYTDFNK